MGKSISPEGVIRYCFRKHICKPQDGLFLESAVNSRKLFLSSLLSMSLGTGMKLCKMQGDWEKGSEREEATLGYFCCFLSPNRDISMVTGRLSSIPRGSCKEVNSGQ